MVVIAGDVPSYLLRPPSAPGSQPAPGRRPVPDLPAVLQARLPRRPRRAICRASWSARSISRRPDGPGPVLVDVPMDIFSADLPVDAFQQAAGRDRASDHRRRRPRRASSTRWRRAERPVLYAGGGVLSARATAELAALAEALELPVAHTLMGKGVPARGSSAAARHDRLLGHADRQREVPDGRPDPRRRHAPRRSELELVGSALHLRHSADAPDPHRRRRRGDRPQLSRPSSASSPTRSWRSRALADAARRRAAPRSRGALRAEIAARPPRLRRQLGEPVAAPISTRCVPSGSSASCARPCPRTASSSPTSAGTRTASASSSRSPCPARSSRRAVWRRWGSARRRCWASRWRSRIARSVALIGDGGFGSNPSVVATAMEAELPVVWLVMDNAGFGTIAGLTNDALRLEFGCLFESRRRAATAPTSRRWRRAYGADGVFIRVGRRARAGAARGARLGPADGDPGADGERADADARALEHQRHLPERQLAAGGHDRQRRRRSAARTCAGFRSWRSSPSGR